MVTAIVRPVPNTFPSALLAPGISSSEISLPLARSQHDAYVAALTRLGASVVSLPPLNSLPDSVFVEDAAVRISARGFALPGSCVSSRAAEAAATGSELASRGWTCVDAPFALDGGDVLRVGANDVFIGVSSRTDERAVEGMKGLFGEEVRVTPVPVPNSLHLKTAVTWVAAGGEGFLVVAETEEGRAVVRSFPEKWRVCWIPAEESYAANLLQVRDGGTVLMPSGFPKTAERVRKVLDELDGVIEIEALDMGEFRKANGGFPRHFLLNGDVAGPSPFVWMVECYPVLLFLGA